jgi:hypothetical protein
VIAARKRDENNCAVQKLLKAFKSFAPTERSLLHGHTKRRENEM